MVSIKGDMKKIVTILDMVFPEQIIFQRRLKIPTAIVFFLFLCFLFSVVATIIPVNGFIAYDWVYFFSVGNIPSWYQPWTISIIHFLNYPILIGITCAAFSMATFLRSVNRLSAIASFLCLPLIWVIFLGQIDGLALFGMLGLPWLVPFALLKPHITFFGLGAKKTYIIAFFIWMIISVLIWGDWFPAIRDFNTYYPVSEWSHNISLGWWGVPFFLATVWFSRGDMDMLMASGAFITPTLLFYHLLPLTPAVARLKPKTAFIAVFLSFLTLSSNWVGYKGWYLGWAFIIWIWINLAAKRYPEIKISKWVNRFAG